MKPNSFDPPEINLQLWEGVSGCNGWDVGASVGNTLHELIFRFTNVIGFEPSCIAMDYLKTIPSVQGVRVYELAISDHDGQVFLDLEEGRRRVFCRTLDSLTSTLDVPDFIKVDTEGHEVQVLEGATFLMITKAPEWLIEVYSEENGNKCRDILMRYGYEINIVKDLKDNNPEQHYWIRAKIHQ